MHSVQLCRTRKGMEWGVLENAGTPRAYLVHTFETLNEATDWLRDNYDDRDAAARRVQPCRLTWLEGQPV